jgi:hypothetical protein
MRLSAEHWRQRAQQVRRLAVTERDSEVRLAMLELAADYNTMAALAERLARRASETRTPQDCYRGPSIEAGRPPSGLYGWRDHRQEV